MQVRRKEPFSAGHWKNQQSRELRERTMAHADNLFNAQLTKAVGSIMVFRIDEEKIAEVKPSGSILILLTRRKSKKSWIKTGAVRESRGGLLFREQYCA
jgi:hypothetical protein